MFKLFAAAVPVLFVIQAAFAEIRVTCIGDSITSGGGCHNTSYVDNLRELLGPEYSVLNSGVSGTTQLKKGLDNSLNPWSYWSTSAWKDALKSKPDIVTIMLGTNDAKDFNWEGVQQNEGDFYALDYVDMIRTVRRMNDEDADSRPPAVFIMVPPPLYEPFPYSMNETIINTIFPTLVRDISSVMDTELIDIRSAFTSSELSGEELTCDGCHPTDAGDAIIASTMAEAIQQYVEKKGKRTA